MLDPNNPFVEAARYLDAECEERDLVSIFEGLKVDPVAVAELSRQRALRMILMERGQESAEPLYSRMITLTSAEGERMERYTTMHFEGVITGVRGEQIKRRTNGSNESAG